MWRLKPLAEHLCRQYFHGGLVQIGAYKMRADAGGVDLFKEVDRHAQVDITDAVDGQADAVLAGVEHAVLAGAVILELQQIVAVFQCVDILGFAGVNEFLFHGTYSLYYIS